MNVNKTQIISCLLAWISHSIKLHKKGEINEKQLLALIKS